MLAGRTLANSRNLFNLVRSFYYVNFTARFSQVELDSKIKWYVIYGVNDLIINGATTSMWLMTLNKSIGIYPIEGARHNPFSDNEEECLMVLGKVLHD